MKFKFIPIKNSHININLENSEWEEDDVIVALELEGVIILVNLNYFVYDILSMLKTHIGETYDIE